MDGHTDGWMDIQTDNVKRGCPSQTQFSGGIKIVKNVFKTATNDPTFWIKL